MDTENSLAGRLKAMILACLVLGLGLGLWAWLGPEQGSGLPILGEVPAFQLKRAGSGEFDSAALAGKVWVASFVFTSCKNSCPMLTAQMKRLSQSLPAGPGFALVSFSVDPDKDTPEKLAAYAKNLGVQDERWSFLTGAKKDLKALIKDGFKLTADTGDMQRDERGHPDILHSSKIVLIDKKAQIRGYYDGLLGSSVEAVRRDAERLAKED